MEIYGLEISAPTNFVRFTANVLGLEYQFKRVNLVKGENQLEEYLHKNPAGKIPALVDEDGPIFESNSICRYLEAKYGESSESALAANLVGKSLRQRAEVDSWMEYISHHLRQGVYQMLFHTYVYQVVGKERSDYAYQEGVETVNGALKIIDRKLGTNEYLVGGALTLADLSLVSSLDPLSVLEYSLEELYPNLHNYFTNLQKQEFYQKCHQNYQGAFAVMMMGMSI